MKRLLFLSALFFSTAIFAAQNCNREVAFFISNNTRALALQQAYDALNSKQQQQLHRTIDDIMRDYHIKHGQHEDMLGVYRYMSNQQQTVENSDRFQVPVNTVNQQTIFSVAKQLAKQLQQESVAVLIPNEKQSICAIEVDFANNTLTMDEMMQALTIHLPQNYREAFTMAVRKDQQQIRIRKLAWLGSNLNMATVKKAFPHAQQCALRCEAYLIKQSGDFTQL